MKAKYYHDGTVDNRSCECCEIYIFFTYGLQWLPFNIFRWRPGVNSLLNANLPDWYASTSSTFNSCLRTIKLGKIYCRFKNKLVLSRCATGHLARGHKLQIFRHARVSAHVPKYEQRDRQLYLLLSFYT